MIEKSNTVQYILSGRSHKTMSQCPKLSPHRTSRPIFSSTGCGKPQPSTPRPLWLARPQPSPSQIVFMSPRNVREKTTLRHECVEIKSYRRKRSRRWSMQLVVSFQWLAFIPSSPCTCWLYQKQLIYTPLLWKKARLFSMCCDSIWSYTYLNRPCLCLWLPYPSSPQPSPHHVLTLAFRRPNIIRRWVAL